MHFFNLYRFKLAKTVLTKRYWKTYEWKRYINRLQMS